MSLGDFDASRAKAEIGASFCLPASVKPEFTQIGAIFRDELRVVVDVLRSGAYLGVTHLEAYGLR
jgi:hypothetical protein